MENLPRTDAELAEDPSPLQEAVLSLMEDAGIRTEINDKIMKLLEDAERDRRLMPDHCEEI